MAIKIKRTLCFVLCLSYGLPVYSHIPEISASITLSARINTRKNESIERLDVDKVQLNLTGKFLPDFDYHVQIQTDMLENTQIGLTDSLIQDSAVLPWVQSQLMVITPRVSQACIRLTGIDGMIVRAGLIEVPAISAQSLSYKPFLSGCRIIWPIGTIINQQSHHMGYAYKGYYQGFGYDIGVFEQTLMRKPIILQTPTSNDSTLYGSLQTLTDTVNSAYSASDFDKSHVRIGVAARINYSYAYNRQTHIGFGGGFSQTPLNKTILVTVVGAYAGASAPSDLPVGLSGQAWYQTTSFKDLRQFAADLSYSAEKWSVTAGLQYQKCLLDLTSISGSTTTNTASSRVDIFNQDGGATGMWCQIASLWNTGARYVFDKKTAAIAGVKVPPQTYGLECAIRFGAQWSSNILALVQETGWNDWSTQSSLRQATTPVVQYPNKELLVLSIDNTDASPDVLTQGHGADALCERQRGWSFGVNYYVSESLCFQTSYEQRLYDFKKQGMTTWQPSIMADQAHYWRIGVQYAPL